MNFWADTVDTPIAVKEGNPSIALWKIKMRHHLLRLTCLRARVQRLYFTRMLIFTDADYYEKP
jgi:hypothetical protein